eukprot:GHVQ01029219.1.p1 GENE.GHVQ01029219.1~~GHVQ01029219.1.p1  ORF type:complete len:956 (-),score=152.55 GHVQ01029219.1:184-3051(-)
MPPHTHTLTHTYTHTDPHTGILTHIQTCDSFCVLVTDHLMSICICVIVTRQRKMELGLIALLLLMSADLYVQGDQPVVSSIRFADDHSSVTRPPRVLHPSVDTNKQYMDRSWSHQAYGLRRLMVFSNFFKNKRITATNRLRNVYSKAKGRCINGWKGFKSCLGITKINPKIFGLQKKEISKTIDGRWYESIGMENWKISMSKESVTLCVCSVVYGLIRFVSLRSITEKSVADRKGLVAVRYALLFFAYFLLSYIALPLPSTVAHFLRLKVTLLTIMLFIVLDCFIKLVAWVFIKAKPTPTPQQPELHDVQQQHPHDCRHSTQVVDDGKTWVEVLVQKHDPSSHTVLCDDSVVEGLRSLVVNTLMCVDNDGALGDHKAVWELQDDDETIKESDSGSVSGKVVEPSETLPHTYLDAVTNRSDVDDVSEPGEYESVSIVNLSTTDSNSERDNIQQEAPSSSPLSLNTLVLNTIETQTHNSSSNDIDQTDTTNTNYINQLQSNLSNATTAEEWDDDIEVSSTTQPSPSSTPSPSCCSTPLVVDQNTSSDPCADFDLHTDTDDEHQNQREEEEKEEGMDHAESQSDTHTDVDKQPHVPGPSPPLLSCESESEVDGDREAGDGLHMDKGKQMDDEHANNGQPVDGDQQLEVDSDGQLADDGKLVDGCVESAESLCQSNTLLAGTPPVHSCEAPLEEISLSSYGACVDGMWFLPSDNMEFPNNEFDEVKSYKTLYNESGSNRRLPIWNVVATWELGLEKHKSAIVFSITNALNNKDTRFIFGSAHQEVTEYPGNEELTDLYVPSIDDILPDGYTAVFIARGGADEGGHIIVMLARKHGQKEEFRPEDDSETDSVTHATGLSCGIAANYCMGRRHTRQPHGYSYIIPNLLPDHNNNKNRNTNNTGKKMKKARACILQSDVNGIPQEVHSYFKVASEVIDKCSAYVREHGVFGVAESDDSDDNE